MAATEERLGVDPGARVFVHAAMRVHVLLMLQLISCHMLVGRFVAVYLLGT